MANGYGLIVEEMIEAGFRIFYGGFEVKVSRDLKSPALVTLRLETRANEQAVTYKLVISDYDLEVLTPPMAKKIASDALNRLREALDEHNSQRQKLA